MSALSAMFVRAALVAAVAAAIALQMDNGFYKALKHKIWPVSRESAPFWIFCCIFTLVVTVLSFRASSQSDEAKRSIDKKKKLIVAQLSQAMKWDQDDEDEKKEDGDKKEEEKKEEDKKKRKPPETPELFKMLFDDIEDRHVTECAPSLHSRTHALCVHAHAACSAPRLYPRSA